MSKRRLPGSSGNTPGKTAPKKSANESTENDDKKPTRRRFFSSSAQNVNAQTVTGHSEKWTRQEFAALVEYLALYWEGAHTNGWPSIKTPIFGKIVPRQSSMPQVRQSVQVKHPFIFHTSLCIISLFQFIRPVCYCFV